MPHYIDEEQKMHFLDSEEHEHLLPSGCVKIEVERPSHAHVFKDGEWKHDLDVEKKKQIHDITKEYEKEIHSNINYMSSTFQTDGKSVAELRTCVAHFDALPMPEDFYWRDFDNKHVDLNKQQLLGLSDLIFKRKWEATKKLHELKSKVKAADTLDKIQAVIW